MLAALLAAALLPSWSSPAEERDRAQRILEVIRSGAEGIALVAAHRGGYSDDRADGAPENSAANVAVAVARGFDLYETDIRLTRDGVFVVVHDDTLDRETDGTGPVEALALAEVRALRKRYRDGSLSKERVATFAELLVAGRGRILFKVDLKEGVIESFDELARLVASLGMEDQVFFRLRMREADAVAEAFARGAPRVEVMFRTSSPREVRQVAERFSPLTVEVAAVRGEALDERRREAVAAARAAGMLVESPSFGDPEQWAELLEAGVRMFHTASPDATLRYLEENGWR